MLKFEKRNTIKTEKRMLKSENPAPKRRKPMKPMLILQKWIVALRNRPAAKAPDLNETTLHQRALKNIRIIALIGLGLILADLAMSMTGGSIDIVKEHGKLYLVRPAAGDDAGHITLNALVKSGRETYENKFIIRLDPQQKRSDEAAARSDLSEDPSGEELIQSEFRAIAAGFNEDLSRRRIPLPMTLDSGESIHWSRTHSTNTLLLAVTTLAMMFLIYRSRLRPLRKREEAQHQSVLRQLPSFINELVLLLNAGLVLSSAFEITVKRTTKDSDEDYFRRNIRSIYHSVKNTNAAMHEELHAFARASGVSELMRVSSIISDNINKGAELNVKLERESERLWLARKLDAEERGRLAETKMTFPLSIFLCVLIVITVSPALLQL